MQTIVETSALTIGADEASGCIRSLRLYGRELLQSDAPASDVAVNGEPLALRTTPAAWTELPDRMEYRTLTEMHASRFVSHYTGVGLDVARAIRAVGDEHVEVTYTVRRSKIRTLYDCPGAGWGALEAPLHVEAITVPCWAWTLFGDRTHMIALNTSGAGPSVHMGWENGPVAEVREHVDHFYRRQYAGDMGFPGAVYYDPETEDWLAVSCARPAIAYNLNHGVAGRGVAFDFLPVGELRMHASVQLPSVEFRCGRSADSMRRYLAERLSRHYEEAPDWALRSTWMHVPGQPGAFASWRQMEEALLPIIERRAATAFFLTTHDRNETFGGTSPNGAGPTATLGPRADYERMIRRLKDAGARIITWISSCGMNPQGEADPDWFIRGVDGDVLPSWGRPAQPHILYINQLHPGYQAYVERWLRYYLETLGMDGFFFDCAGFSYPMDYAPRPWMRYPSDAMLGNIRFYDFVRDRVRAVNPEALVWTEGSCLEAFSNAMSIVTNTPSPVDGMGQRDALLSLRAHGGKRFAIASGTPADVASGIVSVRTDAGRGLADPVARAAAIAGDPFNRELTALVAERSSHDAVHLPCGGGISLLDDVLVVPQPREERIPPAALVPAPEGEAIRIRVRLPAPHEAVRELRDRVHGGTVRADADGTFLFDSAGIYTIP